VRKLLFAVSSTPIWCWSLESEGSSASPNVLPSKSNIRLTIIIAVVAVSLVISALLVSALISNPQNPESWLFKGAYAKYKGSTSVESQDLGMLSITVSVDFAVQLEVVDFNSSHALVSTTFRMSSSFGDLEVETVEEENSTWVPLSQMNFMNSFEDLDLANSYESTVEIPNFGSRTCMVYEYIISEEDLVMSVYVDKLIGWPLKMTVSITGEDSISLNLDINLTETNIPALNR